MHPEFLYAVKDKPDIWLKAFRISKESGLLYYFSTRLLSKKILSNSLLERIIDEEEKGLRKLRNTLIFIKSIFEDEGLDFRVIKLYRGIPYVPKDVDILIRKDQSNQVFRVLKKRGIAVKSFSNGVETQFQKEGLFKVDIYSGFRYLSLDFFEETYLWENPKAITICNVECPTLNNEADFLLLNIHAFFGHRYLSLLDFLYAKSLLKDLNFDEVLYQAKKYQWDNILLTMILVVKDIYFAQYYTTNDQKVIVFPYTFSPKFILGIVENLREMSLTTKTTFLLSTLIDQAFYQYKIFQQLVPVEIPDWIKNIFMMPIYKVRSLSGDRKITI
jgi:hypothetical protein